MVKTETKGFTLVELMIVISIIMILVAMLAPAVSEAYNTARTGRVQARLNELNTGCVQYYKSNNFYPGQYNLNRLCTWTFTDPPAQGDNVTGAQILAEGLFLDQAGDSNWDNVGGKGTGTVASPRHLYGADRSRWHWKSLYAPLNYVAGDPRTDLMTAAPADTRGYVISDRFTNKYLPILYFPSHSVDTANNAAPGIGQFWEGDNSIYLVTTGNNKNITVDSAGNKVWKPAILTKENGDAVETTFNNFSWDRRFKPGGSDVYNSGQYLLIAAGRDRTYGTENTIKNWSDK